MSASEQALGKLIHIAKYYPFHRKGRQFLYLRRQSPHYYVWMETEDHLTEHETEVCAPSLEEAFLEAQLTWKSQGYRTISCGFCYSLPERDEHGVNALFCQMVVSYSVFNGICHDAETGGSYFVEHASREALDIWKLLKKEGKL